MNIYEISFQDKGRTYYFNGKQLQIENNAHVIVETERGLQYGKVVNKVDSNKVASFLDNMKDIIRVANQRDYDQYLENQKEADEALEYAKKESSSLKLDMHFIDGSYTFDQRQLLLNFYADERVDFRELAKRIASKCHTRIELRQIGARDKAQVVGGIGICGRPLCCASCLKELSPISMNMAKDQNLSLNPSKINGACGRLLCCLAYEDEAYVSCSKGMPYVGKRVKTEFGEGQVISVDILNRKYKVLVNDELKEIKLDNEKDA